MKAFALIIFTLILLGLPTMAAAQGVGCVLDGSGDPTGIRDDNIYYTDCFPWAPGDGTIGSFNNDTTRLQQALSTARGSKLIFNETEYHIDGTLTLYSFSVLEGLSAASDYLQLRIIQEADNSVVFSIGEGVHNVAIRDLGLFYEDTQTKGIQRPADATAIMAEGSTGNPNSTGFVFENLRIRNFTKGIYVHSPSPGGWQFDDNQLKDTSFEECGTAILLDAINIGWNMNNIGFASLADEKDPPVVPGQNGLIVKNAGYLNINLMVGNGTYVHGASAAGTFIGIEKHGFVNIQNANGEAYEQELNIDTPLGKGAPIILLNNDLHECGTNGDRTGTPQVYINNASVVSQSNNYACQGKVAKPRVEGWAEVYSSGDRFCDDGEDKCFDVDAMDPAAPFNEALRSGWDVRGNFAMVRSDFQGMGHTTGPTTVTFDMTKAFVDITSGYSYDPEDPIYKPFLSFTNSFYDPGTAPYYFKYRYSFARNVPDGRLEITGDFNGEDLRDDTPNTHLTGFRFKGGPVQLWNVNAADLSDYTPYTGGDEGSMLYCPDCTAGTNPCSTAGGGGGALAIKVQSGNWACK